MLALLLVILAAATALLAARAPLWNDELFTYYIAGLPSAGDVWSELATGVEQTPFFFYLVTRAATHILGDQPLALRVPEMLGFALMCICVFSFVARRSSPVYGFVAVLFPLATTVYGYAYEARAYALVLGFSASALLCWQRAAEGGDGRRLAALGTALSLAAAVGSHYSAVLMVIPLLVGELGRSLSRRRIDWLVVGSFAGALLPLALFAPLIEAADDYSTKFWAQPSWSSVAHFYPTFLLNRKLLVVVGLLIVATALTALKRSRDPSDGHRPTVSIPRHELMALGALVLFPVFGVLLGKLVTGASTERYFLPAVLGTTILIALAAAWVDRDAPILGISLLALLSLLVALEFATRYDRATGAEDEQVQDLRFLERHSRAGVPHGHLEPPRFLRAQSSRSERRGPAPPLPRRPGTGPRPTSTPTPWTSVCSVWRTSLRCTSSRTDPLSQSHRRFFVYGEEGGWAWVTTALRDQGAHLRVSARSSQTGKLLLEVTRP